MKILFLIRDLGQGGAEKVLVNLVNNLDHTKYDVTVMTLFAGGVNEKYLSDKIKYKTVFTKSIPGNSKLMKLLTPEQWHKLLIKEKYDIEISYLEGPAARIISGCPNPDTKLVSWIHVEQHNMKNLSASFRSSREAISCYNKYDQTICVSEDVKKDFCEILNYKKPCQVLYNTVESDEILQKAEEEIDITFDKNYKNLIAVGTLKASKGYLRLLKIIKALVKKDYKVRLYILGKGPQGEELKAFVDKNNLSDHVIFLGYQENPYKYVKNSDLLVCASFAEGFSTAVTEALIVGTPVCTVDVSGMKELLGNNNEYGLVTENDDKALYKGLKYLLDNQKKIDYYAQKAVERGKKFQKEVTVKSVEEMFDKL